MKETPVLVLVFVPLSTEARTEGAIRSRSSTSYGDGWERIFGKKEAPASKELN